MVDLDTSDDEDPSPNQAADRTRSRGATRAPASAAPTSKPVSPVAANGIAYVNGVAGVPAAAPASGDAPESSVKKFCRRFWSSLIMFLAFCGCIHLGQPALLSVVFVVQALMYREVVNIAYSALLKDDSHLPLFRTQNWYWFLCTIFLAYGRAAQFVLDGGSVPYHMFISFSLLVTGFVAFVFSLRKGMYRQQFSMFAWMLLALAVVVLQSTMLVFNMFQGLFWFVLPAILIISNDSWAYVWGLAFGRTPLIQLSPRKTWEGFAGAFVSTIVTAFAISRVMVQFPILTCPQTRLTLTHPSCVLDAVFVPVPYQLPLSVLGRSSVELAPVQLHAVVMGLFASLIAPFGGFFASGFKRAFKVKDFGSLIPGHGGLTDRMDCQLLMGVFVYVYYWSFINPRESGALSAQSVFDLALQLNATSRADLLQRLLAVKP